MSLPYYDCFDGTAALLPIKINWLTLPTISTKNQLSVKINWLTPSISIMREGNLEAHFIQDIGHRFQDTRVIINDQDRELISRDISSLLGDILQLRIGDVSALNIKHYF